MTTQKTIAEAEAASSIPATDPTPAKKKAVKKVAAAKPAPLTAIKAPASMVAAPGALRVSRDAPPKGIAARRWYWLGTLPTLGKRNDVAIAGTTFPRAHETVLDRQGGQSSRRIPMIGYIGYLSRTQIDLIAERRPWMVMRFTEGPQADLGGPGDGIEVLEGKDGTQIGRQGHPIRILTDAECARRREDGAPSGAYTPADWDEDLADHVFCVPCESQEQPRPGVVYPQPLSVTGLDWPE